MLFGASHLAMSLPLEATIFCYATCWCAGNSLHIQTLIQLTNQLQQYLALLHSQLPCHQEVDAPQCVKLHCINEFLFATSLDNINLFQLIRYAVVTCAVTSQCCF